MLLDLSELQACAVWGVWTSLWWSRAAGHRRLQVVQLGLKVTGPDTEKPSEQRILGEEISSSLCCGMWPHSSSQGPETHNTHTEQAANRRLWRFSLFRDLMPYKMYQRQSVIITYEWMISKGFNASSSINYNYIYNTDIYICTVYTDIYIVRLKQYHTDELQSLNFIHKFKKIFMKPQFDTC